MNIEISNETVEKMVKEAIDRRLNTWIGAQKHLFHDIAVKAIQDEVSKRFNDGMIDIPKLASSIASKKLAEEIVDNIGYNIAAIFAEKYGD